MKHAAPRRTVLGINAAYHESAAALIVDDTVVFAVEEERLSRDIGSRVFVGLNDEGHDTDPEGRYDDLLGIGAIIEEFNATQVLKVQ